MGKKNSLLTGRNLQQNKDQPIGCDWLGVKDQGAERGRTHCDQFPVLVSFFSSEPHVFKVVSYTRALCSV